MNLSKNKKRRNAAWALFLTLTALVCSSTGAQPSIDSADFVESDTTLNEEDEVIHYVFVMDDNLGMLQSKTPDHMKKGFINFIEKLKNENPNAFITILESTDELLKQDVGLEVVDYLVSQTSVEEAKTILQTKLDKLNAQKPDTAWDKLRLEAAKENPTTLINAIELRENMKRASRNIVFIVAHGGGHPYRAGALEIESSNLIKEEGIELILLTCSSGNLDLSKTPNIKAFGIGAKNMFSSGVHIQNFMEYINIETLPAPTSAVEFYETYKTFHGQTPASLLVILASCEWYLPEYLRESFTYNTLEALENYYINSVVAQKLEELTYWIPSESTPWFADLEEDDHRGTKEAPWSELSSEYEYLNSAIPMACFVLSCVIQQRIISFAFNQALELVKLRYLP